MSSRASCIWVLGIKHPLNSERCALLSTRKMVMLPTFGRIHWGFLAS